MEPPRRLQRIQEYLKTDIVEMRDTLRFSCDDFSVLPHEDETYTSNITTVADAIQRVSFWEEELQQPVRDAAGHAETLLSDMDKATQQGNESDNISKGNGNGDGSHEQPTTASHQISDGQSTKPSSDSSDDQPMDISSNSSDDGGGIINEKKESILNDEPRPQSQPGKTACHTLRHDNTITPTVSAGFSRHQAASVAPPTPASTAERKKNKKRTSKSKEATNNRSTQPTSVPTAPLSRQTQLGRRPSGPLLHHPSLPPRPPTPSSWGPFRRFR